MKDEKMVREVVDMERISDFDIEHIKEVGKLALEEIKEGDNGMDEYVDIINVVDGEVYDALYLLWKAKVITERQLEKYRDIAIYMVAIYRVMGWAMVDGELTALIRELLERDGKIKG